MSWFGEQILARIEKDNRHVSEALLSFTSTGHNKNYENETKEGNVKAAVGRILSYFRLRAEDDAISDGNINDMIDRLVRPLGVMRRRVILYDKWWRNGDGPLLAVVKETGRVCVLIPGKISGYVFYDVKTGAVTRVTARNKDMFETEALCFYRPLPPESMTSRNLMRFLIRNTSYIDMMMVRGSVLLITLLGALTPVVTHIIYGQVIPAGKDLLIISTISLLIAVAIGNYLMTSVKKGLLARIKNRMDTVLQNAIIGRLLNMPAKFYADKSSGELSQSVGFLSKLPEIMTDLFYSVGITAGMSFMYVVQISIMTPALALPAIITFVIETVLIVICIYLRSNRKEVQIAEEKYLNGLVFSLLSGIQKIKLSGAENRAFVKWAQAYKRKIRAFKKPYPANRQGILVILIQMIGLMTSYYFASKRGVTVPAFAAFSSAYGMVISALLQLSESSDSIAFLFPILKSAEPILEAVPENAGDKRIVDRLSGHVELNNVSFRYDPEGQNILENVNLEINPGEYVAIVGKSGCGKSTLMRLLLGFEVPDEGSIYYNGWDLNTLDPTSFRRQIGTVLQNGKLFAGDIFSNITISAPWLKMEDAWEAAKLAGMEEDILSMPMGMNTIISEGSGGISGGQRQRLMIARAIAPKPSILMFDEATSALDNITQKIVSDSLKDMGCTRIVVAHRLSTIKECDRIIVLDGGKIVEDGTYDELIEKNGAFADLVRRQQVDDSGFFCQTTA